MAAREKIGRERKRPFKKEALNDQLHSSVETSAFRAPTVSTGLGKWVGPLGIPLKHPSVTQRPQKDTRWEENEFTGTSHKEIMLCGCNISINLSWGKRE